MRPGSYRLINRWTGQEMRASAADLVKLELAGLVEIIDDPATGERRIRATPLARTVVEGWDRDGR